MNFLRKYNTATKIYFTLRDFWTGEVLPNHTFEVGDCKISMDGAGYANSSNLPVEENAGEDEYSLSLVLTEMVGATITIKIVDQTAIKVFSDIFIVVETYGNALARIISNLDNLAIPGSGMDLVDSPNATALAAIASSILSSTGVTVGGTFTFAKLLKILGAITSGTWLVKVGSPGTYQILDCEDGATPVLEVVPGLGPRAITIL